MTGQARCQQPDTAKLVSDLARLDLDALPARDLARLLRTLDTICPLADLYTLANDDLDLALIVAAEDRPQRPNPHPDPCAVIDALAAADPSSFTTRDMRQIGVALARWETLEVARIMAARSTGTASPQ